MTAAAAVPERWGPATASVAFPDPSPASAILCSFPSPRTTWWLSVASLSGFVLAGWLGFLGMMVCLAPWLLLLLTWPRTGLRRLLHYRLPWLLPAWAIASAAWSIEPAISFKLGFEFLLFTAVAITAAGALPVRGLLSSFMLALLLGMVLSVALRTTAPVGTTGEVALIGVFGSKNNLAHFCCLSMICSTVVLSDPRQRRALRLLGAVGLLLDPILLLRAHSLGALLSGGVAMSVAVAILVLFRLPPRARRLLVPLAAIMLALLALLITAALQSGYDLSTILASAGKDTSLTGRTFLWSRAREYIAARPILGLGYQAFWVQGHVEAEGLWRYAQIESRSGFHFHNLYFETAVELGWIGVALLASCLLATVVAAVRAASCRPDPDTAFACALLAFYAIRIPVELDFLAPFSPGSLLLPILWTSICCPIAAVPDSLYRQQLQDPHDS